MSAPQPVPFRRAKNEPKPVPVQELNVHQDLQNLRKKLNALKHGRAYVMKDVEEASREVGEVLQSLRDVREGSFGTYDTERNHVDDGALV